MKCQMCDGKGWTDKTDISVKLCPQCNGTGEVEQTNDEWRKTCSTEEFADFLFEHGDCIGCPAYREVCARRYDDCKTAFLEWLKEVHE